MNLILSLLLCQAYPTIIIHGVLSNKNDLEDFANELSKETNYKDTIYNMEIDNGRISSVFMNLNNQCETFSNNIKNLNITEEKINVIGFSQGGLIARCYVEKYSNKIKLVHSLINIATPNMGIYGNNINLISGFIKEYWKNPYMYQEYLENNDFLAYINNEKQHNNFLDYKNNIQQLENYVIIWSQIDTIITPLESSKFEFYNIEKANKQLEIQPLKESQVYINLGLKDLDISNRLKLFQFDCKHDEFKLPKCFRNKNLLETIVEYL